jgi:acyl carrier protein
MTSREQILSQIKECIVQIAPEAEFDRVRTNRPWREQLDIDSFDFLNVLIGIHQRTGVDIPESDYQKVATLDELVNYLSVNAKT